MMKSVVEYKDYRQYILDYYSERKRSSAFTWREFARLAGFASGSYLKLVCDGKTRLLEEGARKTALAMGLLGFEYDYFILMVRYENAKTDAQKKKCFEEMQALSEAHHVKILGSDLYTFYETWKHSVVRELAPLMPGATPGEMAKMCYPEVSASEVQRSLNFLMKAGLLKKAGDNAFELAETSIRGTPDATRLALRGMHREMSKLATPAIDLPVEERHFSGVTMGLSRESFNKIENVLDECRRKIVAIAAEDKDIDQVYRLNLQLFPLTRKAKEREDEEV